MHPLGCLKRSGNPAITHYNKGMCLVILEQNHMCERQVAGSTHLGLNN